MVTTTLKNTAFGDVFFESDEGIFFLDSLSGTLDKVSNTKAELQNVLNTPDGQDHYLMAGLVSIARENGLILESGECYDFKVSPSLNGAMDLENLQKMDFKVSLNISGQITKQIKDLPVGTNIGSVTLEGA